MFFVDILMKYINISTKNIIWKTRTKINIVNILALGGYIYKSTLRKISDF